MLGGGNMAEINIKKTMKHDRINIENRKTRIELQFKDSLTFVTGDSGTGKTYTFNRLQVASTIEKEYEDMVFYTTNGRVDVEKMAKIENDIKSNKNKFVIIDHADIILNKGAREFIGKDINNQYLIFGRNTDDLCYYPEQIVKIVTMQKDKPVIVFNWNNE
jgi:hypothetical protein